MGLNLSLRILRRATYEWRRFIWRIQKKFCVSKVIHTPTGKFEVYLNDEVIGLSVLLTKQYDTEQIKQVFHLLKTSGYLSQTKDLTFIDIGANIGVVGLQTLTMGLCQKVIAIEPEPNNFRLLKNNIEHNQLSVQVVALQKALSDTPGEVLFELDTKNFGDHRVHSATDQKNLFSEGGRRKIKVESQPLDEIVQDLPDGFKNIDLGWMDIQGFEGLALKGGARVFSQGFPMMIEIWPYGLERAGVTCDIFFKQLSQFWSHFFIFKNNQFSKKPISDFLDIYRQIGRDGRFEDLLFVKDPES